MDFLSPPEIHDDPKDGVLERLYIGFLGQTLKGCRDNQSITHDCETIPRLITDHHPGGFSRSLVAILVQFPGGATMQEYRVCGPL